MTGVEALNALAQRVMLLSQQQGIANAEFVGGLSGSGKLPDAEVSDDIMDTMNRRASAFVEVVVHMIVELEENPEGLVEYRKNQI
jgi:hypothetical protein